MSGSTLTMEGRGCESSLLSSLAFSSDPLRPLPQAGPLISDFDRCQALDLGFLSLLNHDSLNFCSLEITQFEAFSYSSIKPPEWAMSNKT